MTAIAQWASGLPLVKDDPHARENAAIVREWLAAVAEGTATPADFDRAIEHGRYIFQYTAVYGPADEYYPECVRQIDRRMALRGLVFCKWRGWIRRDLFDAWKFDRAKERADLPNKGERG
jgi:hypothetical protein